MRAFAIADASKRKAKPIGLLLWEPLLGSDQGRFTLELASDCNADEVPLSLSFCVGRTDKCATPKESEEWVRSRIVPEDRHNITEILRANGLDRYDEVGLLAACEGRSSDDDLLAYEVVLPAEMAKELHSLSGSARADRALAAIRRERSGASVHYAFIGLADADTSKRKTHGRSTAKSIGLQIRAHRIEQGLTQKQLAARAGITQTVLSRIESGSGNPTLALLEDIAAALDESLSVTLG